MVHGNGGCGRSVEICAVEIVAAYVLNNHVSFRDLPELIASVRATLTDLASGGQARPAEPDEKATASQARKSISADTLISFIDGKPYRTLKRHLTANGFNPNSYRAKYGLPNDYPMVAPSYSARRSAIALDINLGKQKRKRGSNGA